MNRLLVALVLCLVLPPSLCAAQQAAAVPNVKAEDFPKLFGLWKQYIARSNQLRQQYATDQSADKKQLEVEFNGLKEKATKLMAPLSEAAKKAYLAAPNQDPQLTEFLVASLSDAVDNDDYEEAATIGRMLVDNGSDARGVEALAGIALFNTNDFDAAQKALLAAQAKGVINEAGARYLRLVEKYKPMWVKEKALRDAEEKAGDLPKVKLETNKGTIVIELFENEAPNTVANFINLVEKGFYNGLTFHRVIPGFMAQGGDPNGDGSGGPGFTIPDECRQENHRNHFRGSLSMAKTAAPDSGGSQFFLTFVPTTHLDGKHTVFGRVVEGMDVLPKIQRTEPNPAPPDRIEKATVLSKRQHIYDPIRRADQ